MPPTEALPTRPGTAAANPGPPAPTTTRTRLLTLLSLLTLLAAALLAILAARRLQGWRDGEELARLRETHTLAGNVRTHQLRSAALGESRRVWVYLPPQYYAREPQRRFPVLYMQDGQNVFDGATAFIAGKEWEVDEAAAEADPTRGVSSR